MHKLNQDAFVKCIGNQFEIARGDDQLILTLIGVDTMSDGFEEDELKSPFTLIFSGPREIPLPQQLYSIVEITLGTLELFLIPIGLCENNTLRYEAIFE